ncbi:putative methionyl-tRNA synthetase [Hordeum vulgare]|nr:putative methionyl-tRNA synthetase [Hordeum vulgare]
MLGNSDGSAHGGFNPNTTLPHGTPQCSSPIGFSHYPRTPSPAFSVGLNTQYIYSPPVYWLAASHVSSLRRGVLPFAPTSSLQFNYVDADMDEIITSGSVAAALHLEFGVQDETMDTAGDIDDELDDAEEEEGRKRRWSIDPITGSNQNTYTYWGRIKTAFDERKLVDPDFANIHMNRGEKAMENRWSTIQMACNKWHVIIEEVAPRPKSGTNVESQMIPMFAMYRADNEDQEFRFLHMFSRIDWCEKWREVRLALDKAKETYSPDAPTPAVAEGRRDGTKKDRTVRDGGPAAQRLQASIKQCIADVKSSPPRREEKSDVRWSTLMINVATKKRNIDLEFLMGADTSMMDETVKAWYIVQRDLILSQMPAPEATTMATATVTMTAPNPNAETTPTTSPTTPTTNSPTTPKMSPTTPPTSPASPTVEEPHHAEPDV